MKKIITTKLVAALLMALAPLLLAASGQISYTATYGGDVTLGTRTLGGATYTTVAYQGLYNVGDPGKPSLPVDFIRFSVPYNATNFTVTATPVVGETLQLDYPVCPLSTGSMGTIITDSTAYSGYYPSSISSYIEEGLLAGENHVITIAIIPFSYDTAGGSLSMMRSVRVDVEFDLSDSQFVEPIVRRDATLRDEGFEITRRVVVNPDDVRENAVSTSGALMSSQDYPYPTVNDSVENPDTYVIITTPEMRHSVRRLAALRMQKGINVKVVTVDEALNDTITGDYDYFNWGGDIYPTYYDDPGKIRNYLRVHYYDRGTKYVLLAGTEVPYREFYGGQADMYYSELDANWLFSFYEEMEKYYELIVGRLLGKNPKQFDNYTDKLFRYELNPGNGDHSYLKRALFTESHPFLDTSDFTRECMSSCFLDTTLIAEKENIGYPTGSAILDSISQNHYAFISTFCEGHPSHIKVYGSDELGRENYIWALQNQKEDIAIQDVEIYNGLDYMDNKYYPAIYFSPLGNTMSYDSQTTHGIKTNYGESFITGKNYGGPVYIGMTANSLFENANLSFDDYYDFGFFSEVLAHRLTSNNSLGQSFVEAKQASPTWFTNWRKMNSCYNFLGDPIIEMWTATPQHFSDINISRTDNSITISGIDSDSTIVSYHSNDGFTGKLLTSNSQVTLNGVSPNSTIMLYKHNHIPYIAPLNIQNAMLDKSQYVIASDVTAGRSIESGRTSGDVIVKNGVEYEIEASGKVELNRGFKVERGAVFSVRKCSYKSY